MNVCCDEKLRHEAAASTQQLHITCALCGAFPFCYKCLLHAADAGTDLPELLYQQPTWLLIRLGQGCKTARCVVTQHCLSWGHWHAIWGALNTSLPILPKPYCMPCIASLACDLLLLVCKHEQSVLLVCMHTNKPGASSGTLAVGYVW